MGTLWLYLPSVSTGWHRPRNATLSGASLQTLCVLALLCFDVGNLLLVRSLRLSLDSVLIGAVCAPTAAEEKLS